MRGCIYNKTAPIRLFAEDLIILSQSVAEKFSELSTETSQVGLKINESETKYMATQWMDEAARTTSGKLYSRRSPRLYGCRVNGTSDIAEEINAGLHNVNRCYHACKHIMKSRLIDRTSRMKMYKTIIIPLGTYECEM